MFSPRGDEVPPLMIKERLLQYPLLTEEERHEIDVLVGQTSEHAGLHEEMRALASLFDEVRTTAACDDDAAFVVARGALEPDAPPFDEEIEFAVAHDPELRGRYEAYVERVRALSEHHDPLTHFESLRKRSPESGGQMVREPLPRVTPLRRAFPRYALAVAASLALVAVAGLLILESQRGSIQDRLGDFQSDEIDPDRYLMTARSADTFRLSPTDSLLLQAIEDIRDARTVRIGRVTHYDSDGLARADARLTEVIERLSPDDYVALEARYLRAKTLLLQEDPQAAMADLRAVIEYEGARTARARALLQEMERTGASSP
jgi:hypothetical protein